MEKLQLNCQINTGFDIKLITAGCRSKRHLYTLWDKDKQGIPMNWETFFKNSSFKTSHDLILLEIVNYQS